MYLREVHAERSIPALRQLIRDQPFGILTTAIASEAFPLIQATHVPFILDIEDETSETELGTLRGHIARANPQAKAMIASLAGSETNVLEQEVLVLFNATTHHYVPPRFNTESKPLDGKVVGTWNYGAAQVYGKARIFFDSRAEETGAFLQSQLVALSDHCEKSIMGYTGKGGKPEAWQMSEAPERYIELLKKAIIGIEIKIDRLEGKFKMGQELSEGDRQGVVEGFKELGTDVGNSMAEIVASRAPPAKS
ncbi:putative transcriptional regulator [Xylariales sp. PMI_506]|nr:putative transcriptional regulator [Xylariales sp. PMI_506]